MALQKFVIIGILAGAIVVSVTLVLVGLIPVFQRALANSSGSSSSATTSAGGGSTPSVGPGTTTTAGAGITTTTTTAPDAGTTTTTAAASGTSSSSSSTTTAAGTTTTTTAATTSSVPLPTCNSAYQAITGHSICVATSQWLLSSGISAADKQLIVNKHNAYRRNPYPKSTPKYGSAMRKLVWDDNIAAVAQQYAKSCPNDHESANNKRSVIGYNVVVGQNLAWGQNTWTEAIDDWFNEYTSFTYGTGAAAGTETGHYTQMVYDETTKIGCGFAKCDSGFDYYYICDYATIQYSHKLTTPFAVGTACASCVNKCDNGLCDCNGLICNTGTINLNTCTCN